VKLVHPPASVEKVYLGGRYRRRESLFELGQYLEKDGFQIMSSWIHPQHRESTSALSDKEHALQDLQDIENSHWCIFLMENPRGDSRGGRHVEFGYALALQKFITIIGPEETIFHSVGSVHRFLSIKDFLVCFAHNIAPLQERTIESINTSCVNYHLNPAVMKYRERYLQDLQETQND